MTYLTKQALLSATDLREEDVPLTTIGGMVRVRALPAAFSSQASSEAIEYTTDANGRQGARINAARMEELQVLNGLVEPNLGSIDEVRVFAKRCGPAFKAVVTKIDELSGVDKEAIERAEVAFPAGVDESPRTSSGADAAA